MKNSKGVTSFYVINYKAGGFILLAADKRIRPVLAYSGENNFNVNIDGFPAGLDFWVTDAIDQIESVQNSSIQQTEELKDSWEVDRILGIQHEQYRVPPPPDEDCPRTESFSNGPVQDFDWTQDLLFNDALPFITCGGAQSQVLAGCVPIAMGMLMRFHQFPNNYNWAAMPAAFGSWETANFIADIHDAIGNVYPGQPTYSCGATGVIASANIGHILKTQFNYSSADWGNYNSHNVENNIAAGMPVILAGNNGTVGHMWLAEGYVNQFFIVRTAVPYPTYPFI